MALLPKYELYSVMDSSFKFAAKMANRDDAILSSAVGGV